MATESWILPTLPGMRRFFARIRDAVDDGRTVLVVVPHSSLTSGLAQVICDGIRSTRCVHAVLDKHVLEEFKGSIPDAAVAAADFLDPLGDSTNRWRAYLQHEESAGKSVLVAGWDVDLVEDLPYWLRLLHGSSLDPEDRPVFVFVVRDSDVDVELLEKEHATHLTVLWWWDVIGLLDSELCAELALAGQKATPLRRAMLAESIGWELDIAEGCARMWGVSDAPSVLVKALSEQVRGESFVLHAAELRAVQESEVGDRPPHVLRNAWNAGKVNAWDGQFFVSARYADVEAVIDRRFWNAQARILMPYLERQRQRIANRFEKLASTRDAEEVRGESGLLELGRMLFAHHRHRVDFGADEECLLKVLVMARNKIAHHERLDDDLYAAIADVL